MNYDKLSVSLLLLCQLLLTPMSIADDLKLEPINLQLKWKHQFQFAGYYAAKEKGFYQQAGLDVTIIEAQPGLDPIHEVIAGRAQFGVGTSELILNRYRGDPVVVLGVIFQHSPLSLITLQSSGIDHIHKLVNRRVMIEPNSAELFAYLHKEGFTAKAFTLMPHSFDINDLLSDNVDAMSVYTTDELYLLEQQGQRYYEFSPRMAGIDFYGDNFFTLASEIKEHPERVNRFIEATRKGWRYAMQNPEEIIQLIYERYSQRHSIEHLRYEAAMMHELMQPNLIDPGYMHVGRWEHIVKTYQDIGQLPAKFDVERMLYFPDSEEALQRIKRKLYYAGGGLALFAIFTLILFRFYRKARINEIKLNIMFANAPLSLILLDEKNQVKSWNTQAEKTFLWSARDIIGKNVLLLVPPEIQTEIKTILDTVHQESRVIHYENANLKKDGSRIICEWLNAPFKTQYDRNHFMLCMARDITERKQLEQQLEQAAHYDNLTGLANRSLILELLERAITLAGRNHSKVAILFLDLNGFKAINDRLGHDAGDLLLKIVAERLMQAVRKTDYVGRLGGDEFLVVLQNIDTLENAQHLALKIFEHLQRPCTIKNKKLLPSTSIGVSLYPDDGKDSDLLILHADQEMYQDKRNKRDLESDVAER